MVAFAAVTFAEGITFSAWLRALAAPVANDGKDTVTAAANSWGYGARTARIDIHAVAPDGNAGFEMGVYNDSENGIGAGDQAYLWVKPMDIVKISYGDYDNTTLMSGVCYGSWNWMRPNAWIAADEDLFMSKNGDVGLMAEVTPMENLYIQAMIPIKQGQTKAGDTYKKLRGGFAYTVPGLANIKGQYIGKGAASDDDAGTDGNSNCTLEAEVDVLAVEGLFAGVGFQYNVIKDGDDLADAALLGVNSPADIEGAMSQKMKIAAGVSYQVMPELKVSASGAFFMYYGEDVDPRFQAGVGVDYDLGDGLAANADVRYLSPVKGDGEKIDNTDRIAFSVGVVKSVSSNGSIGVAFQGATNSGSFAASPDVGIHGKPNDDGEMKNFTWCVPVALQVWF